MKRAIVWVRQLGWPGQTLAVGLLVGFVVWLRLVGAVKAPFVLLSLFGVAVAWSAAFAALLLLVGSGIERLRKRPFSLAQSRVVPLTLVLVGAGLVAAKLPLLILAFDQGSLAVAITGALLAVFGLWRIGRPYDRAPYALLHLGLVILVFSMPREAGHFFLRWETHDISSKWRWTGSESCSGSDVKGKLSIARFRPPYVLLARGLRGELGWAIARKLKTADLPAPNVARIRLQGQLPFADPSCYLPFYKRQSVRGQISMTTFFSRSVAAGRVSCNAGHTLNFELSASMTGIGSCRDLTDAVAFEVIKQLRAQARALTGH